MNFKISSQEYIFIIVFLMFGAIIFYRFIYENSIDNNPDYTIGKVYDIKISKYTVHNIEYKYYYKNKLYDGSTKVDSKISKTLVDNYYEVTISKKNPKRSRININKKINDTLAIIKSGFNMER